MTDEEKTELYETYAPKVRGYIYGKINNNADADDLTSEVFIKVLTNIDSYDKAQSSLSTWIYTITRNTVFDYLRTRRVSEELDETLADTDTSVEKEILNAEMLEVLADALESLSPDERKVIVLRYYSEMKLTDIAEKTDRSYAAVKMTMSRATQKLKKFLEKHSQNDIFIV